MTTTNATTTAPTTWVRLYQVFGVLTALLVLFQFITAGQLFGPSDGAVEVHGAGAIVLHVVSGLAAVAAVLLWRKGTLSITALALPVIVFGFTIIQAATGGRTSLAIHIPGAMILTAGAVWQLIAALRLRRS